VLNTAVLKDYRICTEEHSPTSQRNYLDIRIFDSTFGLDSFSSRLYILVGSTLILRVELNKQLCVTSLTDVDL